MIKDIIKGHINELFNSQALLSNKRIDVCKECPLYKKTNLGYICDKTKVVNPETNEFRFEDTPGFYRGCNCRLEAKSRNVDAKCPAGKWANIK